MARLVVDEVVTTYKMDPSGYISAVTKVKQKNQDLVQSHDKAFGKAATSKFASFTSSAGSVIGVLGGIVASLLAVGAAAGAIAWKSFSEFAAFDSLNRSLIATQGNLGLAGEAMKDLQQLSKAPGLGFEEAVQGFLKLRRSGLDTKFSMKLIQETGNANSIGGGDKESFGRALLAFSQIASKPFLSGEELLQLDDAGINARSVIKEKFGTSDTEELKKQGIEANMVLEAIVASMSKLARVEGGPQNSIDNYNDSMKRAVINFGSGFTTIGGHLDMLADTFDRLTNANVFADAAKSFIDALGIVPGSADEAADRLLYLVSRFVGFGTFLRNWWDGFQMYLQTLPLWKLIDKLLSKPTGKGESNFLRDAYGLTAADDFFEAHRNKMKPTEDRAVEISSTIVATKIDTPASVPILQRIDENTRPLREIASQILGGGALAKNAINRQDFSDLRTGRTGGSPLERAVNNLVRAIQSDMVMRGGSGTRREI